jgi:transcriptional regulator with PAS, ATPase and Fis domain
LKPCGAAPRARNWTSRGHGWTENVIRKIAGGSEKPREGKKLIQQIAAIEAISGKESAAILLSGETGTGKE